MSEIKQNKIHNAIILAGGKGTRLSEQTKLIPKPLVKVGPDPAIIHIIRHFVRNGVFNIFIAGGYKFDLLAKELSKYFNGDVHTENNTFSIIKNKHDVLRFAKIKVIDSGYTADTAERIKLILPYLPEDDKATFITYGDTFSDVNLHSVSDKLFSNKNSICTLTAVNFIERFGILKLDKNSNVVEFSEKSQSKDEFINGGFIACKENLIDYIFDSDGDFSKTTLPRLKDKNLLSAYHHKGYWFAVDSQRDLDEINDFFIHNQEKF